MAPTRNTPLHLSPAEFRKIGHELVDTLAGFLAELPDRPVGRDQIPSAVRDALDLNGPLPDRGEDPGAIMSEVTQALMDHSLFNGHPRFFGYITASPAPIGMLGDLLAAAMNPNVGAWTMAPAATEIEAQTVRWIAELIGYPVDCGGILVSGGNMANFVCFLAARRAMAGWEVQTEGLNEGPKLRVYGSAATHTWIQKACDLFGLGTDAFRWVPTKDDERMDLTALQRLIDEDRTNGDRPFLVIGAAGTVSTGAVDRLRDIARLCRDEKLWFHVDAAYGGFAAASPEAPEDLRALSLADSVAVDPHKWLYAPLEAGCALVRDRDALRNAFAYHPPYYHFGVEEATNYVDFGMQNSRGFRALKVWLALRQAGRDGYVKTISEDIRLAAALHGHVQEHPDLEAHTHRLSIVTFRFVPARLRSRVAQEEVEAQLNDLNRAIQARLEREGEAFVSNAVLAGRYLLRACIVNINTGPKDVQALPEIVARVGRKIDTGA
jgi:glutamate/tyrosine decarboxylase-like PLP-dependent enzyme